MRSKCFHSFAAEMNEGTLRILEAASELFKQHGFKNVTMDDLARRAGISKKTLYQHFENKAEVVAQTQQYLHQSQCEACDSASLGGKNAIEGMVTVARLLDGLYKQINPIAISELQRFYPETYMQFRKAMFVKSAESIAENIKRGIEEGLYRPELDAEILSRLKVEIALLLFQSDGLFAGAPSFSKLHQVLSDHFIWGLMTPKGQKLYQKYRDSYLQQDPKA